MLGEGETGELQLAGPMITPGYHNNEQATRDAFTADGSFRRGDLGRLDEGRLILVGRSKDSVIVNGVNYFSHEIETLLERLDGVARSYVAAFPTRTPGSDTEQLVVAFRPALILPLPQDAFPKTSLGKIQRALMRRKLGTGAYEEVTRSVAGLVLRLRSLVASGSARTTSRSSPC
ncbi:hypothetical protein [Streptomyces sp. 4F14]|uniref:hypothetical protein n=1 Tax=Streptomyces sp. 4F14 TaxID=3394380 RepID=UPI003A87A6E8